MKIFVYVIRSQNDGRFYVGMTESEFISKNKRIPSKKSSYSEDNTKSALDAANCIICNTKYLYTTNLNQGFMRYYYWFENDTLISVHKGVINYVLQIHFFLFWINFLY